MSRCRRCGHRLTAHYEMHGCMEGWVGAQVGCDCLYPRPAKMPSGDAVREPMNERDREILDAYEAGDDRP